MTVKQRKNLLNMELKRIVTQIIKRYRPEKIILFGSLAEDKIHQWSDLDLLIIKKTNKRIIGRRMQVYRIAKPKVGLDLFIYTPQEIKMFLRENSSFIAEILEQGEILYEKRSTGMAAGS